MLYGGGPHDLLLRDVLARVYRQQWTEAVHPGTWGRRLPKTPRNRGDNDRFNRRRQDRGKYHNPKKHDVGRKGFRGRNVPRRTINGWLRIMR